MATRDLSYLIKFDSDSSGLDDAEQAVTELGEKLEGLSDVEIDPDTAHLREVFETLNALADDTEAELQGTAQAVKALGDQLGPSFDSTRVEDFVANLRQMGVTFDQIEANAREFADVVERVDGIKLDAVNQGLTNTRSGLDGVSRSANSSSSALANMVGNSTQDLGQMAGIVGSLGVGIGQMGEYMADASFEGEKLSTVVRNFAGIAVPMASFAAATLAIGEGFKLVRERSEASAEAIETLRDEMEGLEVTASDMFEVFKDPKALMLPEEVTVSWGDYLNTLQEMLHIGDGFSETDIGGILDDANISMAALSRTVVDGNDGLATFLGLLSESQEQGLITQDEATKALEQFSRLQERIRDTELEAARDAETFASSIDEINQALVTSQEEAGNLEDLWNKVLDDLADGRIDDSAAAWNRLKEILGVTDDELTDLANQRMDERLRDEADAAREQADAMREVGEAVRNSAQAFEDFQASVAAAGTEIGNIIRAGLPDLGAELASALDLGDGLLDNIKFEVDFENSFRDALDGLDNFRPDLQELADAIAAGITPDIDIWGNFEPDDAEFLQKITELRDMIQGGIVQQFEQGGTDAANAFVQAQAAAIAESTGLDIAEVYRILGLPADGSIETVIAPIIDQAKADQARAILDALAGIDGSQAQQDRIARIQVLLETGQIDGDIANIAALLLAQQFGIAVSLDGIPQEDIDAAQAQIDGIANTTRTVKFGVEIDDGAKDGLSVGQVIDDLAQDRTVTTTIELANGKTFESEVDGLTESRTINVDIATGTITLPSKAALEASIGVLRVPVDLYVRHTPRIDGAVTVQR